MWHTPLIILLISSSLNPNSAGDHWIPNMKANQSINQVIKVVTDAEKYTNVSYNKHTSIPHLFDLVYRFILEYLYAYYYYF